MRYVVKGKWLIWALLFLVSWCFSAGGETNALRASQPQVLFVFDASQSMYGKLPGSSKSKLKLAKSLMDTALGDWRREIQVGLLAYGHRGRRAPGGNRCRDIELLVPVALDNALKVRSKVQGLSARGTTPLCAALKEAGRHLGAVTKPGTLVLISDGSEECGGDLLETVRVLATKGSQLTVDVLSLGQTQVQNAPLMELARLTSGDFFDVRDEAAASTAMGAIMGELIQRNNFAVSAVDLWEHEKLTEKALSWELYGVEGEQDLVGQFSGAALQLRVTPGLYWIVAQSEEHRYGFQVHVPQAKAVSKRLSLALGEVELLPKGLTAMEKWSLRIRSVMPKKGEDTALVSRANVSGSQRISLPHGHFLVDYQHDGVGAKYSRRVIVESERRHAYDLSFE